MTLFKNAVPLGCLLLLLTACGGHGENTAGAPSGGSDSGGSTSGGSTSGGSTTGGSGSGGSSSGGTTSPSAATVTSQVVDQTSKGVNSATVSFSTVSATVNTDPKGKFSTTAIPGPNTLTISRGGVTLLTKAVTVNTDGSLVEFSTTIPVTIDFGGPDQFRSQFVARPALTVTPTMPYSGQSVTVAYSDPNATSVDVQYSGAGCGGLMSAQLAGSTYSQAAQVGTAGSCQITATVAFPSGPQVFTSSFRVQATTVSLPAFNVLGADFVAGDSLPAAVTNTGTVTVTGVTGPGNLINGAVARLFVQTTDTVSAANIVAVQVALHNGTGYYTIPAQQVNGQLYVDVALDQDYFTTAQATSASPSARQFQRTQRGRYKAAAVANDDAGTPSISFDVQTVDNQGNISPTTVSTFPLTQVGSGTLQISLSWGTSDDLDLHVQEPSGFQIDFGDLVAPDGGTLDLDSNAACSVDNIDTENVTWPAPAQPKAGTYTVGVDYYANCSGVSPVYKVTINNCGNISTFNGAYALGTDDAGATGTEITKFDFQPCDGSEVSGTATYDDYAQTPTGFSPTAVPLPIRFATIEAHRTSDGSLLASGSTDAAGTFDLRFTNTGTPGYYLKLIAANTTYVNQEVKDASGSDWYIKSGGYDETVTPTNTGVQLHATKADDTAPAFNVFDVGVDGTAAVKRYFHQTPGKLTWIYYAAYNPPGCPDVSCYSRDTDTIDVLGNGAPLNGDHGDSDAYDDIVLLHEYGHFALQHFSSDKSPGGEHSLQGQYDPRLGWSEGAATFFALLARGTPEYLECRVDRIGSDVSVTLPLAANIPLGTSDGTQTGFINEIVVSAGMWAIAVPDGKTTGVFAALSSIKGLPAGTESDRDWVDADFVDFLDGYFCTGNEDSNGKLKAAVVDTLHFNYDFRPVAAPDFCTYAFPDAVPPGVHPTDAHATRADASLDVHQVAKKVRRVPAWTTAQ